MYSKSSWDGSLYGYLWIEYRGEQWREEKGVGVGGRDGRGCGGMDMVEGKSSFLVLSESLPGLGMKSRFRGGRGSYFQTELFPLFSPITRNLSSYRPRRIKRRR